MSERQVADNPDAGCPTCGGELYYCRAPHVVRKPAWHCRRDGRHNFDVATKDLR